MDPIKWMVFTIQSINGLHAIPVPIYHPIRINWAALPTYIHTYRPITNFWTNAQWWIITKYASLNLATAQTKQRHFLLVIIQRVIRFTKYINIAHLLYIQMEIIWNKYNRNYKRINLCFYNSFFFYYSVNNLRVNNLFCIDNLVQVSCFIRYILCIPYVTSKWQLES